ncbi:unnamed protein product [Paramecium sonneborni]|uniref:Uncharacterized protein n=1 Tax=Paramecium sonneborni TaxID=65129 RepID=A0A8S1PDN4_9CILI|nr:unnamed protein product [Paramecium sonneborni]
MKKIYRKEQYKNKYQLNKHLQNSKQLIQNDFYDQQKQIFKKQSKNIIKYYFLTKIQIIYKDIKIQLNQIQNMRLEFPNIFFYNIHIQQSKIYFRQTIVGTDLEQFGYLIDFSVLLAIHLQKSLKSDSKQSFEYKCFIVERNYKRFSKNWRSKLRLLESSQQKLMQMKRNES